MPGENIQRHHGRAMLLSGLILIIAVFFIMWLKGQAEKSTIPTVVVQTKDWKKYASDSDGDYYYKMDAKESSPGIVRVWSQVVFNEQGKEKYLQKRQQSGFSIEGYKQLSHRSVLYELNCFSARKEICIQEVLELSKDGKTLDYAKAGTYKDWSDIPPGSVYETLYTTVCPEKK